MAMVDELLFIKEFRERKAETDLQKSRARLGVAAQSERSAEQVLQAHIEQSLAEELRLYADLCARIVKPRDIANVQQDVADMRTQEMAHQQNLETAQQQHRVAQDDFQMSTRKMREASTAREKFVELARTHHMLVAREAERKEDLELEELASVVREREEWGGEPT
jgi:type III secretion protein O